MVDNSANYDFPPDNVISLPEMKRDDAIGRPWWQGSTMAGKIQEEIIKCIIG